MNMNKPKKRGKRYALQQARKLEKTPEEILEESLNQNNEHDYRYEIETNPLEDAVDELFFILNDSENYPLFCYLDRESLKKFIVREIMA